MNQLYILYYSDPNPAYKLYVFRGKQVGLVYEDDENDDDDYFRNGTSPFALDKRNRNVFYISSNNNNIWKGNVDDPDMREVCSHITNICMCIFNLCMYVHCINVCIYVWI